MVTKSENPDGHPLELASLHLQAACGIPRRSGACQRRAERGPANWKPEYLADEIQEAQARYIELRDQGRLACECHWCGCGGHRRELSGGAWCDSDGWTIPKRCTCESSARRHVVFGSRRHQYCSRSRGGRSRTAFAAPLSGLGRPAGYPLRMDRQSCWQGGT